jgi:hypothetical protein
MLLSKVTDFLVLKKKVAPSITDRHVAIVIILCIILEPDWFSLQIKRVKNWGKHNALPLNTIKVIKLPLDKAPKLSIFVL